MECDNSLKANENSDTNTAERVDEVSSTEDRMNTDLVLSLWNLSCNKLNAMYGGDATKVREVYQYVIASKREVISKLNSDCMEKTEVECEDKCDCQGSKGDVNTSLKVIGTISTDFGTDNKKTGNDSHSDTETDQSTSKLCTSFESDMSYNTESESSSDVNNDETESPVFTPNKQSGCTQSLIQSKEKLKKIDTSDDSVEIIDVSVEVKVEPDDMDTLVEDKKPPLIDITNGDNTDETIYNKSSMEPPSGSQILGDKGTEIFCMNNRGTACILYLNNNCKLITFEYPEVSNYT